MNTPHFARLVFATITPDDTPGLIGASFAVIAVFLGILKCISVMRRKAASTVCLCSLSLFLIGWLGSGIITVGLKHFGWLPVVQILWWPILVLLDLAALVLAIVGLAGYDRTKFTQGKNQAIWTIVLAGLTLIGAIVTVAVAAVRQTHGAVFAGEPKREDLAGSNCSIQAPKQWWKINPKSVGSDVAAIGYQHARPEMYMLLVPEQLGPEADLDGFAGAVKRLLERAGNVDHQEEEDVTIGTLKFRRITTAARTKATDIEIGYENWLYVDRGMTWRIVLWGPIKEQSAVAVEARRFVESFRLLAPGKEVQPVGNLVDVRKPEWGIETHLAG